MKNPNQDTSRLSRRLIAYLRNRLRNADITYDVPPTPMLGGYATSIYRFALSGIEGALGKPLVLRLYPQSRGADAVAWESTVQNALAGEGLAVARVHLVCADLSVLGGAFFIMEHLPGRQLISAPTRVLHEILGKTHAELHRRDPGTLIKKLNENGIDRYRYTLTEQFDRLVDHAAEFPWIREAVDWLIDNRPPEPERLSICHRDFHALNILFAGGKVTGILDWPDLLITDPVFDVANTLVLLTIPGKHFASDFVKLGMDNASDLDAEALAALYLAAYRTHRPLDMTNLDYYRVARCVKFLFTGLYQRRPIIEDFLTYIEKVSGVRVLMPA